MFELEHPVRRAASASGWALSRAVSILDEGGEIVQCVGVARDVAPQQTPAGAAG